MWRVPFLFALVCGVAAAATVTIRTASATQNTGSNVDAHLVTDKPALVFGDPITNRVLFLRASATDASTWYSPVTVATLTTMPTNVSFVSLAAGPAVVFADTGATPSLMFSRSKDATGTSWNPAVTISSSGASFSSVAVINSNPAVAFYDPAPGNLMYVRATVATGIAWAAPILVAGTGDVGAFCSLFPVHNAPAIVYIDSDSTSLKYIRSIDASGAEWPLTPVSIATGGMVSSASATVSQHGPIVAYYDAADGTVKFVAASDSTGLTWQTPVAVDSASSSSVFLTVVAPLPCISYINGASLRLAVGKTAEGAAWTLTTLANSVTNTGVSGITGLASGSVAVTYSSGNRPYLAEYEDAAWPSPSVTPTKSLTPSRTASKSVSSSTSLSMSSTPTRTASRSLTASASNSFSRSVSLSNSATRTSSRTPTLSRTSSVTKTISVTSSVTPTISVTSSISVTPTASLSAFASPSSSVSPGYTTTATKSLTASVTPSTTATESITASTSATESCSPSDSPFPSPTPSTTTSSNIAGAARAATSSSSFISSLTFPIIVAAAALVLIAIILFVVLRQRRNRRKRRHAAARTTSTVNLNDPEVGEASAVATQDLDAPAPTQTVLMLPPKEALVRQAALPGQLPSATHNDDAMTCDSSLNPKPRAGPHMDSRANDFADPDRSVTPQALQLHVVAEPSRRLVTRLSTVGTHPDNAYI